MGDQRQSNLGHRFHLLAQHLADVGHLIDVHHTALVYPLQSLARAKRLLPQLSEESLHLWQAQTE